MKYISAFFLAVIINLYSFSQNNPLPDDMFKYSEEEVKNYAWNNPDPKTRNNDFPESWKNESAVFLYNNFHYESKNRTSTAVGITYFAHYRVKLLDKYAVDDFSTLYYSSATHGNYSLNHCKRQKDILGIKVIKPDGSEKIVNSDEFIVEDNKKKVAVPNLEVDDIIDFYFFTYDYWPGIAQYPNFYSIMDNFVLGGKYPVKYFEYQLITDKNWHVKFTTGKYGSKIEEKRVGEGKEDFQFSVVSEDISASDKVLWNLPFQSLPYIKLFVKYYPQYMTTVRVGSSTYRTTGITEDEITKAYSSYYFKSNKASNEYAAFEAYIKKKYGQTTLSNEKMLEEYYYYIRHNFINKHFIYDCFHTNTSGYRLEDYGARFITPQLFTSHIIYGLDKLNIPYDLVVLQQIQNGPIDDVIDINETDYMIRAKLDTPIYFYKPSVYTIFNKLPLSIEGTKGYAIRTYSKWSSYFFIDTIVLPVSNADHNTIIYDFNMNLDSSDYTKMKLSANVQFNGLQMDDYKRSFINYIDMIWQENEIYDTKKWGDEGNESKKFKIQMENFLKSEEEKRKSNFENYVKEQFEDDNLTLLDYKTISTGNRPDDTCLTINYKCELNGFVKKAGNDYIIKAGKLLGSQITLDEKNIDRNIDVYMRFARGYEYKIKIKIPNGYETKGLDALNMNIKNSTGCIISNASIVDGFIEFKVSKYYYHNFEDKEKWQEMKDFISPAALLTSKEILFKKIIN